MYNIQKKVQTSGCQIYIRLSLTKLRFIFALDVKSLKSLFFQVAAVTLKPWMQLEESGVNSTPTTLCRVEELYIV